MSSVITYFEIAAFLSSLVVWPRIRESRYLRLFPVLLFLIVAVETYMTFFRQGTHYFNNMIYNVQVPLQHVLYLYILYQATEKDKYKHYLVFSIVTFVVFTIITTLFFTAENRNNVLSYSFGSILIIGGILMKFYEMLHAPTNFNFLKDPFFYMLFAFLLFNVGTLPYFLMSNWLYFIHKQKEFVQIMISVMSVFNYILYSTYTIAFLWMSLKKVYS